MITLFRSFGELMLITQPKHSIKRTVKTEECQIYSENNLQTTNNTIQNQNNLINLPDIPKQTRKNWIKSKKAMSKFIDELDYSNQIQSTYDITLIERQNYYNQDVA